MFQEKRDDGPSFRLRGTVRPLAQAEWEKGQREDSEDLTVPSLGDVSTCAVGEVVCNVWPGACFLFTDGVAIIPVAGSISKQASKQINENITFGISQGI